MSVAISSRLARAGSLALASGVLLTLAPGVVGAADAAPHHATVASHTARKAKLSISVAGGTKSGMYTVFAPGKDVTWTATSSSAKTGDKVGFALQKLIKGKWTALAKTSKAFDKSGKARATLTGGVAGFSYRVNATYSGATSPWSYVKFTKS